MYDKIFFNILFCTYKLAKSLNPQNKYFESFINKYMRLISFIFLILFMQYNMIFFFCSVSYTSLENSNLKHKPQNHTKNNNLNHK